MPTSPVFWSCPQHLAYLYIETDNALFLTVRFQLSKASYCFQTCHDASAPCLLQRSSAPWHAVKTDFFLADILQSIVWPKGSSDLVWTLKQAKKCNFFFILTSTVWHSSLSACLNSTQRITNYQAPLLLSSLRHTFCSLPFLLMWEVYLCAHDEKKENETLQLNTQSWENWRKLVLSLKFENSPVGEMS